MCLGISQCLWERFLRAAGVMSCGVNGTALISLGFGCRNQAERAQWRGTTLKRGKNAAIATPHSKVRFTKRGQFPLFHDDCPEFPNSFRKAPGLPDLITLFLFSIIGLTRCLKTGARCALLSTLGVTVRVCVRARAPACVLHPISAPVRLDTRGHGVWSPWCNGARRFWRVCRGGTGWAHGGRRNAPRGHAQATAMVSGAGARLARAVVCAVGHNVFWRVRDAQRLCLKRSRLL